MSIEVSSTLLSAYEMLTVRGGVWCAGWSLPEGIIFLGKFSFFLYNNFFFTSGLVLSMVSRKKKKSKCQTFG